MTRYVIANGDDRKTQIMVKTDDQNVKTDGMNRMKICQSSAVNLVYRTQ